MKYLSYITDKKEEMMELWQLIEPEPAVKGGDIFSVQLVSEGGETFWGGCAAVTDNFVNKVIGAAGIAKLLPEQQELATNHFWWAVGEIDSDTRALFNSLLLANGLQKVGDGEGE